MHKILLQWVSNDNWNVYIGINRYSKIKGLTPFTKHLRFVSSLLILELVSKALFSRPSIDVIMCSKNFIRVWELAS